MQSIEIELDDSELALCARIAKDREDNALGFLLERGYIPKFKGKPIEIGTQEGDSLVKQEVEIHRQGVTGELAFCKHFDLYFPNRMRRGKYRASTDELVWEGNPKDADVGDDIEIRTIGKTAGVVNVKERDNPNFNVVGLRRLNEMSSRFRVLGYYPVGEAQQQYDWKLDEPYRVFQVPIELLLPIEQLPFEGRTLGEYERERRSLTFIRKDSPYLRSLFIPEYIDWSNVEVEIEE